MDRGRRTVMRWLASAIVALLFIGPALSRAEAGLPDAVERVKPSVVAVGTYQKTRSPPFLFRGTGFAVDDGTMIATNAHVIPDVLHTENGETMMVLVHIPEKTEPQHRESKVVAVDRDHDLALLRLTGASLPPVTFGSSDKVRDGQSVAFTGFPIGNTLGFFPVTHRGIIASLSPVAVPAPSSKQLDAAVVPRLRAGPFVLFELDATAYPGHSGSPLYDADTGEVVGIVNMGLLKSAKDSAVGQPSGISFAVPIKFLQALLREPH